MKFLRLFLVSVYIVLIILLLLRGCEGCERQPSERPEPKPEDSVVIRESFKADVVMCIDATSSMTGIINTVKENASRFYSDLKQYSRRKGKEIKSMRIRVIGFRDDVRLDPTLVLLDGSLTGAGVPVFEQSEFFTMPEQEGEFQNFVNQLRPAGGGDDPEMGLDAIAMAIRSDWNRASDVRQIIILWTDNATHPVGRGAAPTRSFAELTDMWKKEMNPNGKRLILFAPDVPSWENLVSAWDKTTRHDVTTGGGLTDVDYEEILRTLSERI